MAVKKSVKSKAVVSKKKSGWLRKLGWKRSLYLASASFLLLLSVGYGGYTYWQDSKLEANAAGWTRIGGGDDAPFLACKTAVSSAYGPLWKVTLVLANNSSEYRWANFYVERGKTLVSNTLLEAPAKKWIVKTAYGSRLYNDTYSVAYGQANKGGGGPFTLMRSISYLVNC